MGVAHIRAAVANAEFVGFRGSLAIYHGTDDRGLAIELGMRQAAEDEELFIVVHAMPLRFRNGEGE